MTRLRSAFGLTASLLFMACAANAPPPQATPNAAFASGPMPSSGGDDGEVQAARGAKTYAAACASCHGDAGQGSKDAPPLVGKEALQLDARPNAKLRTGQFHTALDVAVFAAKNMPPGKVGSIPESDYWDVLAFDLKANGVSVAGKHIDATTAATLTLH